jgi:diguanylate cyclase (GGDEF)-like protein
MRTTGLAPLRAAPLRAAPLRAAAVLAAWVGGAVLLGLLLSPALAVFALAVALLASGYFYARFEAAAGQLAAGPAAPAHDEVAGRPAAPCADHFIIREFAAARRGRDVTLVMFGFHRYDEFVESAGPDAAAAALHEFGSVLKRMTRQMNLSARYGWRADAFLSVLSDANAAAAEAFVARVRGAVEACAVELPEIDAGIAVYQPHLASPEEFVQCAEHALAAARVRARNGRPAARREAGAPQAAHRHGIRTA